MAEMKNHCPICDYKGVFNNFRDRKEVRCPECGSLERHRAFYFTYKNEFLNTKKTLTLLHFAPEKCFVDLIYKNENINYIPVDIDCQRYKYVQNIKKMDATSIDIADNTIDVLIANHLLEHIPDDIKAIKEFHRVLKNNGKAYISIPLNKDLDETFEDDTIVTEEERLLFFGQKDHVRSYGKDFPKRLESVDFTVKHLNVERNLFVCQKTNT